MLVSACLLGISCRYDKQSKTSQEVLNLDIFHVPVCPEQLRGLPTPRPSAQFTGGDGRDVLKGRARVIDAQGKDVTALFVEGARQTLEISRITGARWAVLKDDSPSCGTHYVWIDGRKAPGMGVAAALLSESGVTVMNEEGLL